MSLLFGTLDFLPLNNELFPMTNGYNETQIKSEDDDYIVIDSSTNKTEQIPSISNVQKKKLLWQIDYFSVPYYVRTYGNQLFICDKYGMKYFIL